MYAEPFFKFDNQEYLILQQSAQKTIKEEAEYLIQVSESLETKSQTNYRFF